MRIFLSRTIFSKIFICRYKNNTKEIMQFCTIVWTLCNFVGNQRIYFIHIDVAIIVLIFRGRKSDRRIYVTLTMPTSLKKHLRPQSKTNIHSPCGSVRHKRFNLTIYRDHESNGIPNSSLFLFFRWGLCFQTTSTIILGIQKSGKSMINDIEWNYNWFGWKVVQLWSPWRRGGRVQTNYRWFRVLWKGNFKIFR